MKNSPFKALLLLVMLWLPISAHAEKYILIFGDSLSAGYGVDISESWAHLLQQKIASQGFRIINASISGETSLGGRERIAKLLRQYHPSVVILELGANDGLRGYRIEDTEANLDAMLQDIRDAHAHALLIGMRLPPNYGASYTEKFQGMYARLAKKHRVKLLPFLLDGVKENQFQADNLHPSADAQPHIMENVLQSLRPLLR